MRVTYGGMCGNNTSERVKNKDMKPSISANTDKEYEEYEEALEGLTVLNLKDEFDHEKGKIFAMLHLIEAAIHTDYDLEKVRGPIQCALDEALESLHKVEAVGNLMHGRLSVQNAVRGKGEDANGE